MTSVPNLSSNPASDLVADTIAHHGATQRQVAEAMGISPGFLSGVIHGKKHISADFAVKFEQCLGLSAEWLIRTQAFYDYSRAYHGNTTKVASLLQQA